MTFCCFEQLEIEQANQVDPDATGVSHDETSRARPLGEPPAPTNRGKQSSDLQLNKSWRSKKLELEAQIKAGNTKSPVLKPETVPSLSTVHQSLNAGKSLSQFDYNVRIVAPQEWPHFHVPFGSAKKEIQGSVSGRIRVWLFRYHAGCQRQATGGHVNPFNGIDAFGSQV